MKSKFFLEVSQDNFEKVKLIGSGGHADVWLSKEKSSGKLFAIKEFRDDFEIDEVSSFFRELDIMKSLNHPYLLRLFAYSSQKPYSLVTEYIPNGSYYRWCRSKSAKMVIDPTKKTIIAIGICQGMEYLHKHGIIHRDLKSMNILIDDNYLPRICDFGVSNYFKKRIPLTQTAGTANWMAPEMNCTTDYGPAVDVYSFGMLLYEMLTNEVPWKGLDPIVILKKVVLDNERPKIPNDTPKPLQRLIELCWSKNPEERPTFSNILSAFSSGSVFFEGTDYSVIKDNISSIVDETTVRFDINKEPKEKMIHNDLLDLEALDNPSLPEFFAQLKKSETSLPIIQAKFFFSKIYKLFATHSSAIFFTNIYNTIAIIIQSKQYYAEFLKQINLEDIHRIEDYLIDSYLDVLHVIFERYPHTICDKHKLIMKEIIMVRPKKAIILISLYSKHFEIVNNIWPILDLLLEKANFFIKSECAIELLSALHYLCFHFDSYRKSRLKHCYSAFVKCLESENPLIISSSYSVICSFFNPKYQIDFGLISSHLSSGSEQAALSYLIRCGDFPPMPELIKSLLSCSEKYVSATLVLIQISSYHDGAYYLAKNGNWISKPIPTFEFTLKLLLSIIIHSDLRQMVSKSSFLSILVTEILENQYLNAISLILSYLVVPQRTIDQLSKLNFFNKLNLLFDSNDIKNQKYILSILISLSSTGYHPDFNIFFPSIQPILSDPFLGYIIPFIYFLSQYQETHPAIVSYGISDAIFNSNYSDELKPYVNHIRKVFKNCHLE